MRLILVSAFLALLFVLPACADETGALPKAPYTVPLTVKSPDDSAQHVFYVEIADTRQKIINGLMGRDYMPEMAGMLFSFAAENERRFWMKNTLIPLDMIFIKADGTIHHIHENAIPHDLTGVSSNGPVLNVLEINGGLSRKLGITPGYVVHHSVFGNEL